MSILTSRLDPAGEKYASYRADMLAKLEALAAEHAKSLAGGGEKYVERHRRRGKLLARERIELLLDPDTPFLELSPLAAWGTEYPVGAALVSGIGVVEGTECVITASDPTVRGGASNPYTLRKALRANEIARVNRMPLINLVESAGADLPGQKDVFIPGGALFRDLTRLSAAGVPTIAVVFGSSTAGGAYIPGMSDHVVMVEGRAKVFLGGPPLVKMATGEETDDESLGGAGMHARVSGLADYFALDEPDALRRTRGIVRRLRWTKQGSAPDPLAPAPKYDEDELLGIVPGDLKAPFDPREVIARVVDASEFDEFKPLYGASLVTGWAQVHGYPVGVLANARGVLFSEESQKAAQFIQLANQREIPLLFLHNTTGYMVGRGYEQRGMIKHGSMMINAVSNSTVPHISILMGASYGAGHYGMCGRAFEPRFLLAWPSAKCAVMGPQQLAGSPSSRGSRPPRRAARSTRTGTRRCARWSSGRSNPSRCPPSCPAGSTTTASSTRATPVPSSGCASRRCTARRSRARAATASSGCEATMVISTLLVANRGEIARRIFRTCRDLGIGTVAVYSDADAHAPHVREADLAVRLSGTAAQDTYLRADLLVRAALDAGADAVHPGYGFLSENAAFAQAVLDAGLVWVGPPPGSIADMGSKTQAKKLMSVAGVPVLGVIDPASATAAEFPLLVKAVAGGGGRGMRIVTELAGLPAAVLEARAEAAAAFGSDEVFCEPYVERGRHIEVQILADDAGRVWALGDRDCSLQRRHQKVVEEAPAPGLDDVSRSSLYAAATAATKAIGYVGAGTVEFLLAPDGRFWFLEMNTRLQVEHTVTESVFDCDLVAWQLRVAEGRLLGARPPEQRGHAIEARLYAEDPAHEWRPSSGTLHRFEIPGITACFDTATGETGLRLDSGVENGSVIGVEYDAMLAKVIAWAPTRDAAARRLADALAHARIHGLTTNRELLVRTLRHAAFLGGGANTAFFSDHLAELLAAQPAPPTAAAERLAPLAAALADAAAHQAPGFPSGWRNLRSQPQVKRFRDASTEEHGVRYAFTRDGLEVEGEPEIRLISSTPEHVVIERGGIRYAFDVSAYEGGSMVCVDGPGAHAALQPVGRFPEPDENAVPGSLLAPMPGSVVRVAAAEGDDVAKGQPLLWLEAMKMEHLVAAPIDGVLTRLHVAPGRQVAVGAVLAIVEPKEPAP
jgi:propionyl-CoA carboxylase alpha chain